MPSKRHGYLTRKEWLAARLMIQRGRASYSRWSPKVTITFSRTLGDVLTRNGLLTADSYTVSKPFDADIEVDIE